MHIYHIKAQCPRWSDEGYAFPRIAVTDRCLWAAIWVWTFKPGSSARGYSIINHWVIFPYLHFFKSLYHKSYECSLPSRHINVDIGDNTKSFCLKHSWAFHRFLGVLSVLIQRHSLSQGASGRKGPQIHRNSNQQYLHRLN